MVSDLYVLANHLIFTFLELITSWFVVFSQSIKTLLFKVYFKLLLIPVVALL